MAGRDLAEGVYRFLRENTAAKTRAVRDCLLRGADSIYDSGSFDAKVLDAAVQERRTQAMLDKVILLDVQDGGDRQTEDRGIFSSSVVIFVADRDRGIANIRTIRPLLYRALNEQPIALESGIGRGIVLLSYEARSGYAWDGVLNLDFEALRFVGTIVESTDN
jgi:hypothetical protein